VGPWIESKDEPPDDLEAAVSLKLLVRHDGLFLLTERKNGNHVVVKMTHDYARSLGRRIIEMADEVAALQRPPGDKN
jgi:hypothetical protein